MRAPSVSMKVASLKLRCKAAEVLPKLQESPELLEQVFGVPPDGVLVIRDGQKRIVVDGAGVVTGEKEIPPPPKPVAFYENENTAEAAEKLKSKAAAQEEFLRLFPEMEEDLAKFLTATGCGSCRAPVIKLLQSEEARVEGFLKFLEGLDA